jgi:alpha-galactosidase
MDFGVQDTMRTAPINSFPRAPRKGDFVMRKMSPLSAVTLLAAWFLISAAPGAVVSAAAPSGLSREIATLQQWVQTHFQPVKKISADSASAQSGDSDKPARPAAAGLLVLANHDAVLLNGRPDGRPLKIGQSEFRKGLLCHAPSKLVVTLPGPAKKFSSTVGVDANAGGGSIVFAVKLAGKELFRSPVMRGGAAGMPVSVELDGATEFAIEAGDAGDGIECDHADWADAKAILEDGREVWLADLPVNYSATPMPVARTAVARTAAIAPYSFVYGGRSSDQLLGGWAFHEIIETVDANRMRRTQTYVDPETKLTVRCVAVEYKDFPTVEWTLYFRNAGSEDTPILEQIQSLDTEFARDGSNDFLLHHSVGSPCTPRDFAPLETPLGPDAFKKLSGAGGRPTSEDWSYFNVERGGQGVIIAVGWPGQWAATFQRQRGSDLRVCAGQEFTRFKLHPGEEVRSPLTVLQFWQGGDWIGAQNVWRRWMVAHNLPRPEGKLVPAQFGGCGGSNLPDAAGEIAQIDGTLAAGIKLDNWIIDAGWYPCGDSWVNVGTWEPDGKRFPKGLRQVADHLHGKGIEFVVWFEPERVVAGSWLAVNRPEWVLGGKNGGLLNLGNPDAWKWIVDRVDGLLVSEGIDIYRQDHNIDPLAYWRGNDEEDRQGITENKHVTGYLAFWDELLRRHPKMWIDSCASGGRRNDLETMRRAVPLLRSDWAVVDFSPTGAAGQQCQTHGLSLWLPYYGTGAPLTDAYTLRSGFAPAYRIGWDATKTDEYARAGSDNGSGKSKLALLHDTVREFQQVKDCLLADFYPLTPYSLTEDVWIAWQFDRPESGEGVIQAFRRGGSETESMNLKLRGLTPDATYALMNLDTSSTTETSGRTLLEQGLPLSIKDKRGSAIVRYKKK